VSQLEDMALDFLTQLCRSGMKTSNDESDVESSDPDEIGPSKTKGKPAIRIPLADRTKLDNSG